MPPLLKRIRTIVRRRAMERELDAELQFHLDMLAAEYVRRGVAPDVARRTARQTFGGVEGVKDDVRDTWLMRLLETFAQDVRYGARSLRRQKGYALAVIVTMALGIVGALVGGFIGRALGLYQAGEAAGFIMATLGAVLVLFIYRRVAARA